MATATVLATPSTGVANGTKGIHVRPPCRSVLLRLRLKRSAVPVRCALEDGQGEQPPPNRGLNPSSSHAYAQSYSRRLSRSPLLLLRHPSTWQVSTKFTDVLAFSGPAPERINGRLAMVGFVATMGAEIWKGDDLFAQISNGGIPWFLGTTVVLSLASPIPLFKGVRAESKSEGLMTSDAELWNGRFAMLGLVALALTEYLKGSALV